ncbi:MAG: thioredoxin TrxC [Gammaproteobacteria bacterium]|nr:thioredoxin TrxC [Gammaproteobacteria bacterium]
MTAVLVVCPHCGGINRVPSERLNDKPVCGKCHKAVLDGLPTNLGSHNFDRFLSNNDLPVVVDFWAAWCGPCKMMAPAFSQLASQMSSQIRFAKVDTEQAQDIAARFNIRSIPTMILFKKGKEVDRVSGALDQSGMKQWLISSL